MNQPSTDLHIAATSPSSSEAASRAVHAGGYIQALCYMNKLSDGLRDKRRLRVRPCSSVPSAHVCKLVDRSLDRPATAPPLGQPLTCSATCVFSHLLTCSALDRLLAWARLACILHWSEVCGTSCVIGYYVTHGGTRSTRGAATAQGLSHCSFEEQNALTLITNLLVA